MNYKMDYRSLMDMYKTIADNYEQWTGSLESIDGVLSELATSDNYTGAGADSVKTYLGEVHKSGIIPGLQLIIYEYFFQFCMYYNGYLDEIDPWEDARFHGKEYKPITKSLKSYSKSIVLVEEDIVSILNSISDLFTPPARVSTNNITIEYKIMQDDINELDQNIQSHESKFGSSALQGLTELILNTSAIMSDIRGQKRSYKADYQEGDFWKLKHAMPFAQSCVAVYEEQKKNKDLYIEAAKNVAKHVEVLENLEREERERIANAVKMGVAVAGAIAVTIVSAGTAAPVAIGAVTGISAAASAGTSYVMDSWAAYGDFDHIDGKELAMDMLIAGATGFITGCVGGALSTTLKGTAPMKAMLGSESSLQHIVANTCIGVTKDIVTGTINNTITEVGSYFKGEGFHGEKILGLEEGEKIGVASLGRVAIKTVAKEGVKSVIGEGFDVNQENHSGCYNSASAIKRGISGGIHGAAEEGIKGMASRGVTEAIDQMAPSHSKETGAQKLQNVIDKMTDKEEILQDTMTGAAEGARENVKHPTSGDKMYHKEKVLDENGKAVKDADGKQKYNYIRKDEYEPTKKTHTQTEKAYQNRGGSVTRDTDGNTIYTDASPKNDHPWTQGKQNGRTRFYDSEGRYDPSRSSKNYHDSKFTLPDVEAYEAEEYKNDPISLDLNFDAIWKPQAV